jgi:hypothetical protein
MNASDYCGIQFRMGGRDRNGIDCAGLAALWLNENLGLNITCPPTQGIDAESFIKDRPFDESKLRRGDVIFFRTKSGKVGHVAVWLGMGNKILHTINGCESRIDNGFTLLRRIGNEPVGQLSPYEVAPALWDRALGGPETWTAIAVSVVLSAASAAISYLLRPKAPKFRNESGRYGFDALITRTSPELPLPDVLGKVALAGNSPYQTQIAKGQTVTDATQQKINKVVVFASGPIEDIMNEDIHINGLPYANGWFHSLNKGFVINPAQTKAEAVTGTIGGDSNRPSMTIYKGTPDIIVPVDIRAHYDRFFPIYGFSGASYIVFRLIDSTRFPNFNVVAIIKGRKCRTFTNSGFDATTVTGESLTGADGNKVRFKLANVDIKEVTALTVNGTSYSHISASLQTGNVYHLNKTKGYVEFIIAPAAAATISISYKYHPRAWTCNPASQVVYLLTDELRGLGKPETKIDWPAAVAARDYYDGDVTWGDPDGTVTEDRYCASYAVDVRKPILEHITALIDAAYSWLFVSNGKYVIKPRKAESSVFSFNESNIAVDVSEGEARSTFLAQGIPRSQRANQVRVFFHSADTYNAEDDITRNDQNDQDARALAGATGIVQETLRLEAVDRETQAQRYGEMALRENVLTKWTAEFSTTIKSLALEPGDVVDVTHSSQPNWVAKLFRIESVEHDSLDRLHLTLSEYFDGAYI